MDFLENQKERRQGAKQPPPNYFARSVQLRLLLLTSCLVLVLFMMIQARKPENWHWMWGSQANVRWAAESRDSRLKKEMPTGGDANLSSVGNVRSVSPNQLRRDAWREVLHRLEPKQAVLLDQILRRARTGALVDAVPNPQFAECFEQLSASWDDYLKTTRQAIISNDVASSGQRHQWLEAVSDMEAEWRRTSLALQHTHENRLLTGAERVSLLQLQQMVDQISLEQIRDDTVTRSEEHRAWFRLLDRLRAASQDDLKSDSLGVVGFLQLSRQPEQYRGRIVTIRGTAKLAYRVSAPSNVFGIDEYLVFWVKPAGGQLLPYIVYALEVPDQFPAINAERADDSTSALSEEVEITGYFFKRQVYLARDGVNSAPVVLAKSIDWSPKLVTRSVPQVSWSWALGSFLVVAAMSTLLAWFIYRRTSGPPFPRRDSQQIAPNLSSLSDRELAPGVSEALNHLDDQKEDVGFPHS